MNSPSFPINIGIIGLGHIGKCHIQALSQFPELNLVAACDYNSQLAQLLPYHVPFYWETEALLANKNIHTVIIATPNETHFELVNLAFDAGKNVIMEKPAASDFEQFQILDARFRESEQLHIYYAFHAAKAFDLSWFQQYYNQSKNQQRLGSITAFACHFYDPYVQQGEIEAEAKSLGNSWIDSGVNALSVLSELFDLSQFGLLSRNLTPDVTTGIAIQGLAQYQFPVRDSAVGGLGCINTNWTLGLNRKETWLAFGETGYQLKLDHSQQQVLETHPNGEVSLLQDCSQQRDRLLNHYLGVFSDYVNCETKQQFNYSQAHKIHQLLFC